MRRRSGSITGPGSRRHEFLAIGGDALLCLLDPLGELLVGHFETPGELRRSFEWHADHVGARPDALQIGIAPGRAWHGIALRRIRRCRLRGRFSGLRRRGRHD
jgi:hypothetical protein